MSPNATRTLSTAEERREAVLEAAMKVFAERGFHGTPTMQVAKAAGISQAYLFRLFPTKDDLAIAVVGRCNEILERAFAGAAAQAKADGTDVLEAMGTAYSLLILENSDVLMVQMHAHVTALAIPEIREAMQASFGRLYELVKRESGEDDIRIGAFMRTGMAINVMSALDAFTLDADWALAMRTAEDGETFDEKC